MTSSGDRAPRGRRWLWVAAIGVVAVLALGGTLLARWLLGSAAGPAPALPAALSVVRGQWTEPILVPTLLPGCLGYATGGASVVQDAQASGSRALRISLAPESGAGCPTPVVNPDVVLTEGLALESLPGAVSTVSFDRLQLARSAETNADGASRVTLQWHCLDMMCRLTGTTSAGFPESDLVTMATSVAIAAP